jgi:hypothetical protein
MPRKRRYPKARRNTAAELQAWGPVFERGPYLAGDELARIAAVLGEDWEEAPHPEGVATDQAHPCRGERAVEASRAHVYGDEESSVAQLSPAVGLGGVGSASGL